MMRVQLLLAMGWVVIVAPAVWAQKGIEITPFVGRQFNSGVDISTSVYNRIDVQNGMNYGISGVYLLREYTGVEFMWNHNNANTSAHFTAGGTAPNVFDLRTNQYLGDFVIHFTGRESHFRPFVFFGGGVSNLAPDRSNAGSITRFAWAFGGGAKYNFSEHLGVRVQAKASPTYINAGGSFYWCLPVWGGCWSNGQSNFLQEVDISGGITFRF
jgi:opacity protein-like surface antigen